MEKFKNKIYQEYRILNLGSAIEFLGDEPKRDLSERTFYNYYKALLSVSTNETIEPLSEYNDQLLIGEFDISKAQTGKGPLGEVIINEGKKDIYEDIIFNFLNLSNYVGQIESFHIYSFAKRYGLLVSQPLEKKFYKDKYHLEPVSLWRSEIALINSLTKTYYHYQNKNIDELKKVFIKKKDSYLYFDDSYSSDFTNNIKKPISISLKTDKFISPSGKFELNEIFEQLFVLTLTIILNSKLNKSTRTYIVSKSDSEEFRNYDQNWIEMKSDVTDLLTFIWKSFANFLFKKTRINMCKNEKCKKYFSSQKFNRAKFHSDQCRAAYARDAKMWEIAQLKLMKNDNMILIDERTVGIGKLKFFDALLLNKKNDKVVAMIEFSFSEIDEKSLKWNHMREKISKNLNYLYNNSKINHAFLINKNGNIFEWDVKKKIHGKEIKRLPEIKDLVQSNLSIDKYIRQLIDLKKKRI